MTSIHPSKCWIWTLLNVNNSVIMAHDLCICDFSLSHSLASVHFLRISSGRHFMARSLRHHPEFISDLAAFRRELR
jgi:hypothetical protein